MSTAAYMIVSAVALIAPMGIVAILFRAAGDAGRGVVLGVGGLLAAWFAVTSVLGGQGLFLRLNEGGFSVFLGVSVLLVVGLIAVWLMPALRQLVDHPASRPALVAVQTYRVAGVAFLIALAAGQLPAIFAVPAGVGDFLVGLTALSVAASVRAGRRRRAVVWNVLGILDLVIAITLGLAASPGLHLLAVTPTTKALFATPLLLAPTFAVPLSIWLHVASLRGLLNREPVAPPLISQRLVSR
jgi:hypothetical protein